MSDDIERQHLAEAEKHLLNVRNRLSVCAADIKQIASDMTTSTTAVVRYKLPVFDGSGWFWPGADGAFAR